MVGTALEKIHPKHLADLRASGLSDETIAFAGVYSEDDPAKIGKLLNWEGPAKSLGGCLVIPRMKLDGTLSGCFQLKPDKPRRKRKKDGTYRILKYETPAGDPLRAYFPAGALAAIADPAATLFITEGVKKALKATQEGFSCIGLSGVENWSLKREKDGNGKKIGQRRLIDDLAAISWTGREVFTAFDADMEPVTRRNVDRARRAIGKALEACGAKVVHLDLPLGADGTKCGVDDFLVARGANARADLQVLLDEARARAALVGFDAISARLDTVLGESGPAGLFRDSVLLVALAECSVKHRADFGAIRAKLRAAKVGMRDFERVLKPLIAEKLREIPPVNLRDDEGGGFFIEGGCICRTRGTPDGPVTVPLCNFVAWIVAEIVRDDGAEQQVMLEVEGRLHNGRTLRRVHVSAAQFTSMAWVIEAWGSDCIVWPGEWRALGPAIQALTDRDKKRRATVYGHLGWVQTSAGTWVFLHAGGAIGSSGSVESVSVQVEGALQKYDLSRDADGCTEDEIKKTVREYLSISRTDATDSSDSFDGILLLAIVYRAAIRPADFGVFFVGPSGSMKTEVAALLQRFFGRMMDARNLPANWSSTANSLEGLAFAAACCLLVVDDFCPAGSGSDVARLHRDADRLLRGQGNNSGRGRMRHDGTLRPDRPPRGLILSTGEDRPRGHSLAARNLFVDFQHGMINTAVLTECQAAAAAGTYSACMAAFLRWLAPKYGSMQNIWADKVREIRAEFGLDGVHARTASIAAELLLGFRFFAKFAMDSGAIKDDERQELIDRCRVAIHKVCMSQPGGTGNPAQHFASVLGAVISSGRGHLAGIGGDAPDNPGRWGWRWRPSRTSTGPDGEWEASGSRVGWVDDHGIYLQPGAAFAAVKRLAAEQDEPIVVTQETLWKRCKEDGFLIVGGGKTQRNQIQKTTEGTRRYVVALRVEVLGDADGPAEESSGGIEGHSAIDGGVF